MFPAANGVWADVEIRGKHHLAGIQGCADFADFSRGDFLGWRREYGYAKIDGFSALVGERVAAGGKPLTFGFGCRSFGGAAAEGAASFTVPVKGAGVDVSCRWIKKTLPRSSKRVS